MRIRYMLALSVGVKVAVVLLCMSVLYVHRVASEGYFKATATPAEQWQLVKEAQDRDQENDLGLTGLMYAAIYGQLDLAKALYEYGANLNLQSKKEQQSALHYAINNMRSPGSQQVGYYLTDIYANTMLKNIFGQIPLHLVLSTDVTDDRTKMVEYQVKNGADINAQTGQGDTLMHLAVNLKDVGWVETILKQWASIINLTIKNNKGMTPYEYAVQLGFESVQELLQKDYPKIKTATEYDTNGLTGLMLAIMRKDQKEIEQMVKDARAINMVTTDRYANSTLHIALVCQYVPAITALVKHGATMTIKNSAGEVPAFYLIRLWDVPKKLRMAPLIIGPSPQAITTQNNRGDTLVHAIIRYNDMALLQYIIEKHKTYVQTALDIKNNALESPRDMVTKLRRVQMSPLLDGISTLRGKSNRTPPVPTATK